jgi:hypothetical protein
VDTLENCHSGRNGSGKPESLPLLPDFFGVVLVFWWHISISGEEIEEAWGGNFNKPVSITSF